MPVVKRYATYEDLEEAPDTMVAELIEGDLIVSPRPASPHARSATVLGSDLLGSFDGPPGGAGRPGGWWFLFEPELHLGRNVLVPDVAAWRRESMTVLPNTAAFTQAPDWLCEVVSPSTGGVDRGRKIALYARAGVSHLWIVDPMLRTIEVYRLEGDHWVVASAHGGSDPIVAEPFETVTLDPARWWLEPAPDRPERPVGPPAALLFPRRPAPCILPGRHTRPAGRAREEAIVAAGFTIEVLPGNVIEDMVGKIREAAARPGAREAVSQWRAEHGRELWHKRGHDFAVVGQTLMYLHDGPDGMLVPHSRYPDGTEKVYTDDAHAGEVYTPDDA